MRSVARGDGDQGEEERPRKATGIREGREREGVHEVAGKEARFLVSLEFVVR